MSLSLTHSFFFFLLYNQSKLNFQTIVDWQIHKQVDSSCGKFNLLFTHTFSFAIKTAVSLTHIKWVRRVIFSVCLLVHFAGYLNCAGSCQLITPEVTHAKQQLTCIHRRDKLLSLSLSHFSYKCTLHLKYWSTFYYINPMHVKKREKNYLNKTTRTSTYKVTVINKYLLMIFECFLFLDSFFFFFSSLKKSL